MSKQSPSKRRPQLSGITGKLAQVGRLLDTRQWQAAVEMVKPLSTQHPNNLDVWSMLLEAYIELEDKFGLWQASQALLRLQPDEPAYLFNAFNIAMMNAMIFLADKYANEFLRRFPDDENAVEIRKVQPRIKEAIAGILASSTAEKDATTQDYIDLELCQMALNTHDLPRAEQIAKQILQRTPSLVAPLNNLSIAYLLQGKLDTALSTAQQVLEVHPDNIHALSNLIQYLVRAGRKAEAEALVERLCAQTIRDDWFLKQIEALTYLGDDKRVIALFEANPAKDTQDNAPFLYHLVAVAYANQGNRRQAERWWRQALKLDPSMAIAQQNLDNLWSPVEAHTPPFPYSLYQWVPQQWIEDLSQIAERYTHSNRTLKAEIDKLLQTAPGLRVVLPILFERGDKLGRDFALRLAVAAKMPLLRDFALGEYGTDEERISAAQQAAELGLLPRGKPVELLIKGKRTAIFLFGYEITDESDTTGISKPTQKLIANTHAALTRGDYAEAEKMARHAIEVAPDTPSLWNHLAAALDAQKKTEAYDAVSRELFERFPHYFFANIGYIRLLIRESKLEEARKLLDPLMQQEKFHRSEFTALCVSNIEYFMASHEPEGAKSWYKMWEDVDPENPGLWHYKRLLKI